MKNILIILLLTINLMSHSIIDDTNIQNNYFKCKKIFKLFKEPVKHDFYTNVDNYLVGLTYYECDNPKDKFNKTYYFYALIEIDNKQSIIIKNGIKKNIETKLIERYKINMQQYLYYETLNDKK